MLEGKRIMSVNVFIKRIKTEKIKDFIQMIIEGKHDEIGLDSLITLKKNLPDKPEVRFCWNKCICIKRYN